MAGKVAVTTKGLLYKEGGEVVGGGANGEVEVAVEDLT